MPFFKRKAEPVATCFRCRKPCTDLVVTAMGKNWHPEHLTCRDCILPVTDGTFNIQNGEPVCQSCFIAIYADNCYKCKKPIRERSIKALNKTWHEACFMCAGACRKPLAGCAFVERDGIAYCRNDFNALHAIRCKHCHKPILENALVALNDKWHRECFKCRRCSKPIVTSTFALDDSNPVCLSCI